jgi:hypothetical protein
MVPGFGRGHIRKNHIYMCLYWGEKSSEPAGHLVKGIQNCSKGQVLFKGEILTMVQKFGEVIEKFSPREPLGQNSSDLHESSLT